MAVAPQKLSSLTIFFPFLNDEGTVAEAIELAFQVGHQVTRDLEVIAIHGGDSRDHTWQALQRMKRQFPKLKLLNKRDNKIGYAVIKHGFVAASKDWIFYTDGDLQYDVNELLKLVELQRATKADVVNGYKLKRGDAWLRTNLAKVWSWFITKQKQFPIRDIDCDFRLMRRRLVAGKRFKASGAAILEELIDQLVVAGGKFAELPVTHRARRYGRSNYRLAQLVKEKLQVIGF